MERVIQEAREVVVHLKDESVKSALLEIIDSGRAVSIAERFNKVEDGKSLVCGICKGIMQVRGRKYHGLKNNDGASR